MDLSVGTKLKFYRLLWWLELVRESAILFA
jgi:hypothetical protein